MLGEYNIKILANIMGVLRKSTNLKFKARIPKRKIADKMWILIMKVEEKLNAEKSAEEEMCKIFTKERSSSYSTFYVA